MEKISRCDIENIFALTPVQEGILFHYLKDPRGEIYFEQLRLEVSGLLDIKAFERAWEFLAAGNAMLRTVFRWEETADPVQMVLKKHKPRIIYYDLSDEPGEVQKNKRLDEVKEKDLENRFDLRQVPFRVTLCKIHSRKYQMILSHHHILYDGWSNSIIINEFFTAYNSFSRGETIAKPVKTGFDQFVRWYRQQDKEKQGKYWKDYLEGFHEQTRLPLRQRNPGKNQPDETGHVRFSLERDIQGRLEDFVKTRKVSPASLLYTVWGILLQRYTGSEDVVFGVTVSGRTPGMPGIETIVGLFINTLPLRLRCRRDETAGELVDRIHQAQQKRSEYEFTSLVDIKKWNPLGRHKELFDSVIVIENYPLDGAALKPGDGPLVIESYSIVEKNHYGLSLEFQLFDAIELNINYRKDTQAGETIIRLFQHFREILKSILNKPGNRVSNIEIVTEAEKNQILYEFNNTDTEYPGDRAIHRLFEEQAEKSPHRIALVANGQRLTYSRFNLRVNRLARLLRSKGVQPDTLVAIVVERSLEMMVGIWGVMKAGGAYLPVDPHTPVERVKYMLRDSYTKLLLGRGPCPDRAAGICPYIDLEAHGIYGADPDNSENPIYLNQPENLAYVIYTSGSTGKPKGVMIEHFSLVNRLHWMQSKYPLHAGDSILQKTPFSFDVSVWEICWWAIAGASVCLLAPGGEKDPAVIAAAIETNAITVIHFVPSMLNLFLEYVRGEKAEKRLATLKQVFSSGEALLPSQVELFNRLLYTNTPNGARLSNLYGPTEATIDVSYFDCSSLDAPDSIPIGKPIHNTKLVVLDRHGHLQPVGVPGELGIAGDGLARGYLNRPELAAERFIPVTCFSGVWGTDFQKSRVVRGCTHHVPAGVTPVIYKTGDLACWLPDGNIEFLGRLDHQVKIRGFRIELGEVERQLALHSAVEEVVVVSREAEDTGGYLDAYMVYGNGNDGAGDGLPGASELKTYLAQRLPDYMIPSHFTRVEKMPLTHSGKVDRKALTRSGTALGTPVKTAIKASIPKSGIEKKIAGIWKTLLEQDHVGMHENFFDMGGNSFSAIRLSSRLKEAFGKEVPVVTVFNYPTIATLAAHLSGVEQPGETRKEVNPGVGSEDIAVIGMAGCFPGAATIQRFWDNLEQGIESIAFFTPGELQAAGVDPRLAGDPDYVPAKGVLENKDMFDAAFFGYTPSEALIMDPQVRILHECCWEALENAGYAGTAPGWVTGLYAGASPNPYWEILPLKPPAGEPSFSRQWETLQFSDKDFLTTRIAYKLDLNGPCVTLQTACSTSLVAIDLACRGLISGACDMALAGGVSVTFQDEGGYLYQEGMIMSPDGHCRVFDAGAKGTLGGNGAGIVVLKRLAEAAEDGDRIYAVIKGSAVTNDGTGKAGFAAPGVNGQVAAIRGALHMGGIQPDSITYIEAHGTGTPLGDLVEVEALKKAFNTSKKHFCALGSVKANIGHLDAAAGVAGFIKAVLVLNHRLIPPGLHFNTPNPRIDFENSPFYVNSAPEPLDGRKFPLRAGVSSFGIGGTNAHVILEEAPRREPGDLSAVTRYHKLILLSARTESALRTATDNFVDYLMQNPAIEPADAAYTLQTGRKRFQYRKCLVCTTAGEAIDLLIHEDPDRVHLSHNQSEGRPVVFMFPGQGAQYVNMGRDLYRTEPDFREEMDRCFKILEPLTGHNIKHILYPDLSPGKKGSPPAEANETGTADNLTPTGIAQPVLFIFEYSLAKVLVKWGIEPQAMTGHSIGEYVAACLAGVFSLEDALQLVVLRGKLMQAMPAGAMVSVPLPEDDLRQLLKEHGHKALSLAAVNGPSLCVVSGSADEINVFSQQLKAKGTDIKQLHTSHAFHSRMMEPILQEFEESLGEITFAEPNIPYISNVSGQWITAGEASDAGYWARHIRETVRFSQGLDLLLEEEDCIYLEVGPGRTLGSLVRQNPRKKPGQAIINLVRHPKENTADDAYWLTRIGQLWLHGNSIDWSAFYSREKRSRVPLPTYPFERQDYAVDPGTGPLNADLFPSQSSPPRRCSDINQWFYLPSWERSVAPLKNRQVPGSGYWLVFIDSGGIGNRLVKTLRAEGESVVTVEPGAGFARNQNRGYTIHPREKEHYLRLFRQLGNRDEIPGRILYLWGITGSGNNESLGHFDDSCLEPFFYSLAYLAAAAGESRVSTELQLGVVTDHMQEVIGGDLLHPEKAGLPGLCTVISQEYPNLRCRSIDIAFPAPGSGQGQITRLIDQLIDELDMDTPNPVIAYRGDYRWERIFKTAGWQDAGENESSPLLKEKGTYLITGGLGKIGLVLAEFLARTVKARLILVGRSGFPAGEQWPRWLSAHPENDPVSRKIIKLQQIEASGGEVRVLSADVSKKEQLQDAVVEGEKQLGRINGIIHAAGITGRTHFQTLANLEESVSMTHFQAKVKGLHALETVFKERTLDFCLVMSSIASVLGGVGFAAYSAANHIMDARVNAIRANRRNPTPWISTNWEGWQLDEEESGGLAITPGEGIRVFQKLLARPSIKQVVISTAPLCQRLDRWVFGKPESPETHSPPETFAEQPALAFARPDISTSYTAPRDPVETQLAAIWADFFGIEKVGVHDNFFELGGDSLKAIGLSSEIGKKCNITIPLAEIFNRPTIAGLAVYMKAEPRSGQPFHTPGEKEPAVSVKQGDKENHLKPFPLTPLQEAYLVGRDSQFEMGGVSTHIYKELKTSFEIQRINRAFNRIISRHSMLRTIIQADGRQQVIEVPDYEIEAEDLTHLEADQQQERILEKRRMMSHHIFETHCWPLFEIKAFKLSGHVNYLFFSFDHLLADAASLIRLAGELTAYCHGPELELPELEYTFRDYVLAYRELRDSGEYERCRSYWLGQLEDFPASPALPLKQDPAGIKQPHFRRLQKHFVSSDWTRLKRIASENNITPSVLLCTAYAEVLAYWSNQTRLALNLTLFNRYPFHPDVDKIIGDFTSVILLPIESSPGVSFWEKANALQYKMAEALEHRYFDGIEFIREIRRYRKAGTRAIMPVVFTSALFETVESGKYEEEISFLGGRQGQGSETAISQTSQVYLDSLADEINGSLELNWDFVEELFDTTIIETIFRQYVATLEALARGDEIPRLEPPRDHQAIIAALNGETCGYPVDQTIHSLFEEQVAKTPDRAAVVSNHHHLTYRRLNKETGQLARLLKEEGVSAGGIVPVMLERSLDMIVAIIAILKAGAAYLPIDPSYPLERVRFILADCAAETVVIAAELVGKIEPEAKVQWVHPQDREEREGNPDNLEVVTNPTDPAYIIYTSGTTGIPKGAVIEHKNVVRLMVNDRFLFGFGVKDTWTMFHSYCFDFSVWEMYGALLWGGKLVLISKTTARDTPAYLQLLRKQAVTVLNQTPSAFYNLIREELSVNDRALTLRYVIFGGEALVPKTLAGWKKKYPRTRLINMFGITETTVHVTYKEITDTDIRFNTANIGKPIPSLTCWVVNQGLNLVPIGVPGELCVGGDGVGRGYLNRPELTRDKFIKNYPAANQRIYRSGDRVKLSADGELEYLGRIDNQVKIRGHRIERGEIESCLLQHEAIQHAVVIARSDTPGENYLCAYIVTRYPVTVTHLRSHLSERLPLYMVPSYFIQLEDMPLTRNGKVNVRALPHPSEPESIRDEAAVTGDTPVDAVEATVIRFCRELLKVRSIGRHQDFFDLGGDSIKATVLATRIRKEFNIDFPLNRVFEEPTVHAFAQFIRSAGEHIYPDIEPVEKKEYYPQSSAQKRLFFLEQFNDIGTSYNMPFVLKIKGKVSKEKVEKAFAAMIARHETLRTSFQLVANEPVQKVTDSAPLEIRTIYREKTINEEDELRELMDIFVQPFDLAAVPLLRVGLVTLPEEEALLLFDMHHIISDGTSLSVLIDDFVSLYSGKTPSPLRVQYKDFSVWQESLALNGKIRQQETYWLDLYSGDPPCLDLITDYSRPEITRFDGDHHRFALDAEDTRRFKEAASEIGATLFMNLLAVFITLMYKYTGQEDIIVGTVAEGRSHSDLRNIIGMFVNSLAIRSWPQGEKTYLEFLKEVKETTIRAFENQDLQFDDMIDKLNIQREPSRHPLYDVLIALQNYEQPKTELEEVKFIPLPFDQNKARYDIALLAQETDGELHFNMEYSTSLFKISTAEKIGRHYIDVIKQVGQEKHVKLKDISIADNLYEAVPGLEASEAGDFNF
jgi:amino acid adenylation domain-containing protein